RLRRNFSWSLKQQIRQQLPGAEASRNAEALVPGGQPELVVVRGGANQGEFVWRGCPVAGPTAGDSELAEPRHVIQGALQHAVEDWGVDFRSLRRVLARRADQDLPGLARLDVEGHRV